jgi:CheY-like chemotaxis protein
MNDAMTASTERGDILIVDDTPANLDVLCGMLRDRGYRVRVATNGSRALTAARAECPDLIMLDVNMPVMNGYEVCHELKSSDGTRSVPVIFISALDEVVDKVKAFEAGGADYVTKPFQFGEVLARIENQLKIARLQRQLEHRNSELQRMNEELRNAQQREARIFGTLSEVLPGTVLDGKYRLDSIIGSGGFGTVFCAVQLSLNRPVAVKVLQALSASARPEDVERFQREGMSACRVNHPSAVAIIDSGVSSSGIAYLVMELLEGRTLADELDEERRLPLQRVAEILVPVCQVLAAAHAVGIVHRDIKPANIFLHRNRGHEVIKVLDFGLAKLLGDAKAGTQTLTAKHEILGTPFYMSPERLRNEPHDGRADVYSLGMLTYEMLTGTLPFDDHAGFMSIAMLHISGEPVPLRSRAPELPASLETLVGQALAKDPSARPTVTQFERDLIEAVSAAM